MQAHLGLIGLGVMGQNLALNMVNNGYTLAVYDRAHGVTEQFLQGSAQGKKGITEAGSLRELISVLKKPRKIMLMINAGPAVDGVIEGLLSYLEQGDVIIDGGNSYFKDTIRRSKRLEAEGLYYLGVGISGGEEGALKGPSIMPGGSRQGWGLTKDLFLKISAKVDHTPCCSYLGPDGVGHFVKMVHNGIEYGDMQLISEAYFLLRELLGMNAAEIGKVFKEWNKGELDSYLMEISAEILEKKDVKTGKPIVDLISDRAGQKGTGKWTSQEGLELGVSIPTITEAVFARCISAIKEEREVAAGEISWVAPDYNSKREELIQSIRAALYASKICSYAQGFALLKAAAAQYGWKLNFGEIALLWRGGCIIRARFLTRIKEAFAREPGLNNLLIDPYFKEIIERTQAGWRKMVSLAAQQGIPVAAFSSALSYYDSYRRPFLPANLIQAQRDYFGAHTYERLDCSGTFHTDWLTPGETVNSEKL